MKKKNLLSALESGKPFSALSEEEKQALWLEGKAFWADMQETLEKSKETLDFQQEEPRTQTKAKLDQAFEQHHGQKKTPVWGMPIPLYQVAASLLLLVVAGFWLGRVTHPPEIVKVKVPQIVLQEQVVRDTVWQERPQLAVRVKNAPSTAKASEKVTPEPTPKNTSEEKAAPKPENIALNNAPNELGVGDLGEKMKGYKQKATAKKQDPRIASFSVLIGE